MNLLRISFPDLRWPETPDLSFQQWAWPEWELPGVDVHAILDKLHERFPDLAWPDLPNLRLSDLTLPRMTLPEYEVT